MRLFSLCKFPHRIFIIMVVISAAILAALIVMFVVPYLQKRNPAEPNPMQDIQAVPVNELPDVPIPDDFVRCHLGPLDFSVPASMVIKPEFKTGGSAFTGVLLRDEAREVFIGLPTDNQATLNALRSELADYGGLQSIPRLYAELYSVSYAGYKAKRESMTQAEQARYQWLLAHAWLMRLSGVKSVETLFSNNLERLLITRERGAVFEWYSIDGKANGTVMFDRRGKGQELDLGWMRSTCRSLHYAGGVVENKMTKEEVEKLFRIEQRAEPKP